MSKIQTIARALAPAIAIAATVTFGGGANAATSANGFAEGFDVVDSLFSRLVDPWSQKNNSTHFLDAAKPDWIQGEEIFFEGQMGGATSYISVDYQSTSNKPGMETISNWLISPTLSFENGDVVSFYTRTVDLFNTTVFPDRLELRFSAVGGTDVGTDPTGVGTFTTLLLEINPDQTATGYPDVWTNYTSTINGLSGPTNGAIAFRYFVVDGGIGGANSNYIGIDTFDITAAVPEPSTYLMMALGLVAIGLRRTRAMRS